MQMARLAQLFTMIWSIIMAIYYLTCLFWKGWSRFWVRLWWLQIFSLSSFIKITWLHEHCYNQSISEVIALQETWQLSITNFVITDCNCCHFCDKNDASRTNTDHCMWLNCSSNYDYKLCYYYCCDKLFLFAYICLLTSCVVLIY